MKEEKDDSVISLKWNVISLLDKCGSRVYVHINISNCVNVYMLETKKIKEWFHDLPEDYQDL